MSASGVAYKSDAPSVLAEWDAYAANAKEVSAKRAEMADRLGRDLMVNSFGFGHGNLVVGIERLDTDDVGDLLFDGALRVAKSNDATVIPNLRRKAGKALADEFGTLDIKGPTLNGMPDFTLRGNRILRPALFHHNQTLWVMWSAEPGNVDETVWRPIPLSAYFAASEAHDRANAEVSS